MEDAVIIWALGRDGPLTCGFLGELGFHCEAYSTWDEFYAAVRSDAGALIIAAELLTADSVANLHRVLHHQPPWSDLPLIVVANTEAAQATLAEVAEELGNVALLHRPVSLDTLATTVRTALRARRRQYQVRDLLRQREESERRKDEFLAMLAHELRNPLATVRTGLELLRIRPTEDVATHARMLMERQVVHLTRLVDDLLDVSRITRGKIDLQMRTVNLTELLPQSAECVSRAASEKSHDLEVITPKEPLLVEADLTRLEQMLGNVLNNAIKFTPPGGRIVLSAVREGDMACIRVKDNGIGVAPQVLGKVFDLFAQSERTLDRSQGGLGIGLTVVRSLAELHGGTAEIFSEGEGQGTEVVICLPCLTSAPPAPLSPSQDLDGRQFRPRRVLIIEDNLDSAELLTIYLESQGHHVVVAHDGPAGVAAAQQHLPQSVVCDIGLPGLNGYEVVQSLRSYPPLASCQFIALTGYGDVLDRERSRRAGFHRHLTKPLNPQELAQLIAEADECYDEQSA